MILPNTEIITFFFFLLQLLVASVSGYCLFTFPENQFTSTAASSQKFKYKTGAPAGYTELLQMVPL